MLPTIQTLVITVGRLIRSKTFTSSKKYYQLYTQKRNISKRKMFCLCLENIQNGKKSMQILSKKVGDRMRVIFRVDASTKIGTGHVMRCLVLAEQLRKRQAEVRFICCYLPGTLMQFIREQGFEVKPLAYSKKDSEHSQDMLDAQTTVEEIKQDDSIDYLVVDHYKLDYRWERVVKPFVGNLIVIDDLANRRHDCDCLVDQNL